MTKAVPLKVKTARAETEAARIIEILRTRGITVEVVAGYASYSKGKREEHKGMPKRLMHLLAAKRSGDMHPCAYGRDIKQLARHLAEGNTLCPSAYRVNCLDGVVEWIESPMRAIIARL